MKLCVNCKYMEKKQAQVGPQQMAMIPFCAHPELVNPVDGGFLPCQNVRGDPQFCGVEGKHWEENPKAEAPPPKSNVIALA